MELGLRLRLICDDPGGCVPRVNAGLRAHGLLAADGARPEQGSARPATLLLFDDLSPKVLNAVEEPAALEETARSPSRPPVRARRRRGLSLLRRGASDAFACGHRRRSDRSGRGAPRALGAHRLAHRDARLRNHPIGTSPAWLACLRRMFELSAFSDGPVLLLREADRQGADGAVRARARPAARPARPGRAGLHDGRARALGQRVRARARAFAGAANGAGRRVRSPTAERSFSMRSVSYPSRCKLSFYASSGRTYKRVGSNAWHRTNFRLICATRRDLRQDVAAGRFRGDFYPASPAASVPAPAARARQGHPAAGGHFLHSGKAGSSCPGFDRAVARFLIGRSYPGNVRELRQLVERIGDRHVGPGRLTPGDVPEDEWASLAGGAAPLPPPTPAVHAASPISRSPRRSLGNERNVDEPGGLRRRHRSGAAERLQPAQSHARRPRPQSA